jgi:asparagine synthase (glutamine-hydrolysing)
MMEGRYLLLIGPDAARRETLATHAAASELVCALNTRLLTVLVDPALAVVPIDKCGLVLGAIMTPGRACVSNLSASRDAIFQSRGQHLVDRYWGGYVAVFDSGETVDIVRAPFGWLPAFHVSNAGLTAIASDLDTLIDTGLCHPRLDPDGLARHLLLPDIRRRDTCLLGVRELRGGDRMTAGDRMVEESLWTPWRYLSEKRQYSDREEAFRQLRDMTVYCVRVRTRGPGPTLALMSGGLDSSIMAAALRAANRETVGLTFVTDNPSGDEREPAQRVAQHLGFSLGERHLQIDDVDVMRSSAAHLPRPVARSFTQATQSLARLAAQEFGAARIVDGGAGDNIFCSMRSPAPLADCLRTPAGRAYFWPTARTLADLSGASMMTLAWRGWKRSLSGRVYRRSINPSFLSARAIAQGDVALDHLWLQAPSSMLPGKSVQAALLAPAQGVSEDSDPRDPGSAQSILVSQPLIETCLRIPIWWWFDRGCNRAAARHAFAADLPEQTTWRRSKGSPDSFMVELLEANRPVIRTMLADGVLAGLGLLDVPAILEVLDDCRPARGFDFARILQLADAEAWARSWPTR